MNSTPQMVSAAGETASLLSQFGPAIIILAIFLILFLAIVMYMVMQNKESQRVQNENLKLLLEAIINKNEADQQKVLEQQKEDSFDEKNLMDLYMKLNTKLKNECKDAMETLGSDRTAIYTFHNGSQNTHGLPFFKFSCICEYIAKGSGSRSKMKLHNSIPLNLLDDVMNTLWAEGHYEYYPNRESESDDNDSNIISKLLLQDKDKTCIFYTIYDMENKIIGFILSEFSDEEFTKDELKEKKKYLKYLAEKISPILEFSSYHKNMRKDAGAY